MQNTARLLAVALTLLLLASVGCAKWRKDRSTAYDATDPYAAADESDGEARRVSYEDEVAPEDKELEISDFSLDNINKTVKKAVGLGPKHGEAVRLHREATKKYAAAAALRAQGEDAEDAFIEAAETFIAAGRRWPQSALHQDALFMSGEAYFFAEHYPSANTQYEILLKEYPNTHHIDKVEAKRFSIARYWLHLNDSNPQSWYAWNLTDKRRPRKAVFTNAVGVLDRIRIDDPTGKFADDATMAAGNAQFADGNWTAAAGFYEDLRKTFPSSEHQFNAHFLELKCRLNSYEGPNYSAVPLQNAKELLVKIRKQFPEDSNKHRETLSRAGAEIDYKLAEREMGMAKYFDRRWEYGAARYYYRILASDFPDTKFGKEAKLRLLELKDKPDKPRQQMGWLVNLFPDPYEKPLVAIRPSADEVR